MQCRFLCTNLIVSLCFSVLLELTFLFPKPLLGISLLHRAYPNFLPAFSRNHLNISWPSTITPPGKLAPWLHHPIKVRPPVKSWLQDSDRKISFLWVQSSVVLYIKTLTTSSNNFVLPLDFLYPWVLLQSFTLRAMGNQHCPSKSRFLLLFDRTTAISAFAKNIHKRPERFYDILIKLK